MASEAVDQSTEPSAGERSPPPHHARRPMNAFLIFCKRHRSVVRNRYPHLENRSITKILGEWWASLEPSQKGDYTELARKYKEAFLEANPKFKWYKLPAPPLRTLMTRPSNQNKPHKLKCEVTCGPITPGKLADESQMGNLSSLLTVSPPTTPTNTNVSSILNAPKPPKKRYLDSTNEPNGTSDQIIGLKTEDEEEDEDEDGSEQESRASVSPLAQLRTHAAQQMMNNGRTVHTSQQQIIDRVVESMWENGCENNNCSNDGSCCLPDHTNCDNTESLCDEKKMRGDMSELSDEGKSQRRQSYRTCKGQRYREFMSENNFNKKARRNLNNSLFEKMGNPKKRERHESTSSESSDFTSHTPEDTLSPNSLEQKQTEIKQEKMTDFSENLIQVPKTRNHSEASDGYHSDSPSNKRFKAADFNLDEKIEALPSLSLEEFQMKKKARKKRSGGQYNNKVATASTSDMNQGPLVGSQKRKAPKQRITRLDLQHNTRDTAVVEPDVLNNMGLATLAEVAASIDFERL